DSYFNEAERLDPRNVNLLTQHALSYVERRRLTEALRKLDQVLNITPDDVDTLALKAAIAQAEGDLPGASAILAPLRPGADQAGAQESWRQARNELEPFLKEQQEHYLLIGDLALTNIGLGNQSAALALLERAARAITIGKDAIEGPIPIEFLARVAARMRD